MFALIDRNGHERKVQQQQKTKQQNDTTTKFNAYTNTMNILRWLHNIPLALEAIIYMRQQSN